MLTFLAGMALIAIGSPQVAFAQSLPTPLPVATTSPLEASVAKEAALYGIDPIPLYKTLYCESQGVETAIGDKGLALGVAQIRTDFHPEITRAQAFDMDWSVAWAAKQFAAGRASWWSCYRQIFE